MLKSGQIQENHPVTLITAEASTFVLTPHHKRASAW